MSRDELTAERYAGIDMVPVGESFETNFMPDDGPLTSSTHVGAAEVPGYERAPRWWWSASETTESADLPASA